MQMKEHLDVIEARLYRVRFARNSMVVVSVKPLAAAQLWDIAVLFFSRSQPRAQVEQHFASDAGTQALLRALAEATLVPVIFPVLVVANN